MKSRVIEAPVRELLAGDPKYNLVIRPGDVLRAIKGVEVDKIIEADQQIQRMRERIAELRVPLRTQRFTSGCESKEVQQRKRMLDELQGALETRVQELRKQHSANALPQ